MTTIKHLLKKTIAALALCALLSGAAVAPVHAATAEHVTLYLGKSIAIVDGSERTMPAAPKISAGRTFVPLRATAEAFGCDVYYNPDDQGIRIEKGDHHVTMGINRTVYHVNGSAKFMDVAPYLSKDGTTMVPVRYISEAIGFAVDSKMQNGRTVEVHFTR